MGSPYSECYSKSGELESPDTLFMFMHSLTSGLAPEVLAPSLRATQFNIKVIYLHNSHVCIPRAAMASPADLWHAKMSDHEH